MIFILILFYSFPFLLECLWSFPIGCFLFVLMRVQILYKDMQFYPFPPNFSSTSCLTIYIIWRINPYFVAHCYSFNMVGNTLTEFFKLSKLTTALYVSCKRHSVIFDFNGHFLIGPIHVKICVLCFVLSYKNYNSRIFILFCCFVAKSYDLLFLNQYFIRGN